MKGSKRSKLATEHETINMQPTKKKSKNLNKVQPLKEILKSKRSLC